MKTIRLAAGSINTTPLDWAENLSKILGCIREARARNAQILCLPELCITGYGCEDMFLASHVLEKALDGLRSIVPATNELFVCVGLPMAYKGCTFNCVASIFNKTLLGITAKQHLAGDGIHYEPRWFKPWEQGKITWIDLPKLGEKIPFGDTRFEIEGTRIGYEICEDAWVSNRPGAELARQGVDIILNPSASHFAFGKIHTRERFVLEGSRAFQCAYVYANLNGNEAGRVIYGGCLIAAPGEILAHGPRFHTEATRITTAVVNLETVRNRQIGSGSRTISLGEDPLLVSAGGNIGAAGEARNEDHTKKEKWEDTGNQKEEEFTRAVALGLRDYMRKSHTNGYVISLSGGADSAAGAALVLYMSALHRTGMPNIGNLLTTVYQRAANSSEKTERAAARIAEAIGATHHTVDITHLVEGYTKTFEATARTLDWTNDDTTLQNIQARARGPMAWLFANTENKLLLSTSNRSEAAVGYATMDGDTCGSISPLAGIDKTFLLEWLLWASQTGPLGIGRIQALECILVLKPTAELRPGASQTDEDDLMPYPVLNCIEQLAIRDKLSTEDIQVILTGSPLYSAVYKADELHGWVKKFFTLWTRNQWKRDRYAISFRLDEHDLDPKSGCRFPVLSGKQR